MTVTANGFRILEGSRGCIPAQGPWHFDLVLDADEVLSGRVTIDLNGRSFVGTTTPAGTDTMAGKVFTRVVAGAAGWGKHVGPKPYHNGAGVKVSTVATDVARECGETLGRAPATKLGIDYARIAGLGSDVLREVVGGLAWYVDEAGTTHIEARGTSTLDTNPVLDWSPLTRVAKLDPTAFGTLQIGTQLKDQRFNGTKVVRQIVLEFTKEGIELFAWCGEDATSNSLADAIANIAAHGTSRKAFGKWRYRIVRMAGYRADLRAVNKAAPVPSLQLISMLPGIAGAHHTLQADAEVYVEFLEGDPTLPRVTGFSEDAAQELIIGKTSTAAEVATKGDTCRMLLPPQVFTGTIGGAPASGVITSLVGSTLGTIETTKVTDVKAG